MPSIPQSARFLQHILPSDGWFCLWIQETKKHLWSRSVQEMAEQIALKDGRGDTVFFATASYRERGSRRADNVKWVRAFWQDLDVGEGPSKHATQVEALQSFEAFRTSVGLPMPTYVNSGFGVHLYWTLEEALDPATWRRRAAALKQLMIQHQVKFDRTRAADPASILRPVGAHNRKDPENPREVVAADLTGPYPMAAFKLLEDRHGLRGETDRPQRAAGVSQAIREAASQGAEPSDPALIAGSCVQLARMRDTRGVIPEPDWKACLEL